jgi:GTPase
MITPIVSIVGRQNVGKSTLFNAILKKKVAITYDFPGVTRDIIRYPVEDEDGQLIYYICDTPGLDIENLDDLSAAVIELSFQQLLESHVVIFLMDKRDIRDYDFKLVSLFQSDKRFANKNIIHCVNKSDNPEEDFDLEFFYRQGIQEVLPISALGRRNLKLLGEKISFFIKDFPPKNSKKADIKIAIVGKPNSGKSSLLNALTGITRSAVSEMAGTTRDSINSIIKFEDKLIEIIDTAGIRKQSQKSEDPIEFYSYSRAIKTIEASDLVVHIFDATKGIGEYDKKIFSMIREKGKLLLFAVNKWDLIPDKGSKSFVDYQEKMISRLHSAVDVPAISISATEKQRTHKLLEMCIQLYEKTQIKVTTHELSTKLRNWIENSGVASFGKKRPKIFYVTQTSSVPFKLILFVNHENLFKPNVRAFLKTRLLGEYNLTGVPIVLEIRERKQVEA